MCEVGAALFVADCLVPTSKSTVSDGQTNARKIENPANLYWPKILLSIIFKIKDLYITIISSLIPIGSFACVISRFLLHFVVYNKTMSWNIYLSPKHSPSNTKVKAKCTVIIIIVVSVWETFLTLITNKMPPLLFLTKSNKHYYMLFVFLISWDDRFPLNDFPPNAQQTHFMAHPYEIYWMLLIYYFSFRPS